MKSNKMKKDFNTYQKIVGKFKIINTIEDCKKYMNTETNTLVLEGDTILNFDIDNTKLNISINACLKAEKLTINNIYARDGLFCESLDCVNTDCDFIICNCGIKCENIKASSVKTNYKDGIIQRQRKKMEM